MLQASPKNVIYVMRHGSTALDDSHRNDSWIDLPLSDEGRNEVVATLSDYLKLVPITCIYAAPFKRTQESAHILKSGMVSNPEIEISPESKTWNLGVLAGEVKQPNRKIVQSLLDHPDRKALNGESYNEFCKRFDAWLEKQKKDAAKEGPLLLVLSGSNCRRISELLFNDRDILDIDEAGLFMMYPDDSGWTAVVIAGHRDAEDHVLDS